MTTYISQATAVRRAGFGTAARAEWGKLWSVRSSWITLTIGVLLGAGFGLLNVFFDKDPVSYVHAAEKQPPTPGYGSLNVGSLKRH